MKIKLLVFLLFMYALCIPVYSQNSVEEKPDEIEIINSEPNMIFFINSFNYNVTGRTLPFMLNSKTELKKGEEIKGYDKLVEFIENKKQLLINERVLKDNVRIEYSLGTPDEEGKIPVDLEIFTEDTWNVIALPYPKIDSNSGMELTIKARDYNFFGTMNPLRLDIGYKYDREGRSYYNLMLDSGIPVPLFGLKWLIDFDNDFVYRPDRELEYFYKNSTGLSVEIPIDLTTLTVSFHERFILNDELSERDKRIYNTDFQEGLYLSSNPKISWKIPTPLDFGYYGFLTYTPGISAVINHELSTWELLENRHSAKFSFDHNLGFGRVDWIGNFKKGYSVNVSNSFDRSYNFARDDWDTFQSNISFSAAGYFIFTEFIGLTSRIKYRHYFNDYDETGGDVIRGIADDDINASYIASFNLEIPVRILVIRPSEWFPNNNFMRIFDFDMHIVPVFDIAYYQDYFNEKTLGRENLLLGGGIEFVIFPSRWRSLFLRFSAGWDFSNIESRTPMEFFIGMELYY